MFYPTGQTDGHNKTGKLDISTKYCVGKFNPGLVSIASTNPHLLHPERPLMKTTWRGLVVCVYVCVSVQKDTATIKPRAHQEDVVVCCSSSPTKHQITARLSTVSVADEWQRQEKLILSHLGDALKSGVYLGVTRRSSGMKDSCMVGRGRR